MENKKLYVRIIINLLTDLIFIILGILLIPKAISFFFPFVIAFILSLIANPVVKGMEKRIRIKRKHGSAIIIIAAIAAVVGGMILLGRFLFREAGRLTQDLPNIIQELANTVRDLKIRFSKTFLSLPESVQSDINLFITSPEHTVNKIFQLIALPDVNQAGGYAKTVGDGIFKGIITILATYFMIADRTKMGDLLKKTFPESWIKTWDMITGNFKTAVSGYFKAQFKIMIILIVIMSVVFLFLRIDYGILLAILIAFIDFLPVFGTGLIFWPWALIDFVNRNYVRAIVILALYLACQFIKQLLQPKMVGDSIGLSPFATLIFMFIGYQFFGVVGLILGIPVGMVIVGFYKMGVFDRGIKGIQILLKDFNEFRKF